MFKKAKVFYAKANVRLFLVVTFFSHKCRNSKQKLSHERLSQEGPEGKGKRRKTQFERKFNHVIVIKSSTAQCKKKMSIWLRTVNIMYTRPIKDVTGAWIFFFLLLFCPGQSTVRDKSLPTDMVWWLWELMVSSVSTLLSYHLQKYSIQTKLIRDQLWSSSWSMVVSFISYILCMLCSFVLLSRLSDLHDLIVLGLKIWKQSLIFETCGWKWGSL